MEKHSSPQILIAFAYFKNIALWFLMHYFLYSLSLSLCLLPSLHKRVQENVHHIPVPKEKVSIIVYGFHALQTGLLSSPFGSQSSSE